jgi:MFS transporter, DHA1 family, staphyloferrin B biosynthesis exporter
MILDSHGGIALFSLLFQTSRQVRHNFKCDFSAGIFYGVFYGGLNAFILVQARRLGATTFEVGLLAALPSVWLMLSPIWAKMFANDNPFKMVFFADGTSRSMILLLLASTTAHWYLAVFTLHYFFGSISATVYGNAMRQAYPAETRGTLMGWVRVGSALAQVISIIVTGILMPKWGVGYLFPFLAVFGICSAASFGFSRKAIPLQPRKTDSKISAWTIFKSDHQYRRFIVALFLFGLATATSLPAYPLFQVDTLKVSDAFISTFSAIIYCSALIFYYLGGYLIDRYSPLKVMMIVFAVNIGVPVVYYFVHTQWPLLFVGVLQGIVNAGLDLVTLNCVLCMAGEGEINSYMAVNVYMQGLRGTLGPLLAPVLIQFLGYKGLFIVVLVFNCIAVWQLFPLIRRNQCTNLDSKNFTAAG